MLRFQLTLSQSTAKMCAHASICAWTCENQSKNIYACLDLHKSLHRCLLKKIRLLQFAQIFSKTLAHGRICALICANPCARFDLRFNLRKSQRKFSRKSCSHPSSSLQNCVSESITQLLGCKPKWERSTGETSILKCNNASQFRCTCFLN